VNFPALFERGQPDPPIVYRTALSLHDITSNLLERASDWRDSAIPPELRKIGVTKLILEGEGNELSLEWGGKTSPVNNPACFLTVVRTPQGGSEVTARFGRGTFQVFGLLLLLTTPLQALGREHSQLRWFFVAAQITISLAILITGRSDTPILKSHLLRLVEEATRATKRENSSFSRTRE